MSSQSSPWQGAVRARLVGMLLVALALPLSAWAQVSADSAGVVAGRVISASTGEPIARAQVTAGRGTAGVVTDDVGRFSIAGVRAGAVTISVRALGYTAATHDVTVAARDTVEVMIAMFPLPVALQPVRTVATSEARERFEEGTGASVITL